MDRVQTDNIDFDFDMHRRKAVEAYQKVRPQYEAFGDIIRAVLAGALRVASIKPATIEVRTKTVESFGDKAATPAESDPNQPKYSDPLDQIMDLTGARIITFFPRTVEEVDQVINAQFEVLEKTDKADLLFKSERLGYQSVHYLVKLKQNRGQLPEYENCANLKAEIQVRTILQHAWAEIEHDIQYKSMETIPIPIKRRFIALAGLLEIADREFQAIQDEDERMRQEARVSVEEGRLAQVEITGDALKAYLDKRFGPDGRMTLSSYEWSAQSLKNFGFEDFQQIDECISAYDHDELSRELTGGRQGQLTRFELVLLASMGDGFIKRHPFQRYEWWRDWRVRELQKMRELGIPVGSYIPREKMAEEDNQR